MKIEGINMTYEGLVLRIQGSYLAKDVEAMQPHIRAFVERAVTFTTCPECGGTRLNAAARSSKIRGLSIADACAMQIERPGRVGQRPRRTVRGTAAGDARAHLDAFVEIGLGYLCARPLVGHAFGR